MNNFEDANQTRFSVEEPIFTDFNVEMPVDESQQEQNKKPNKRKKILIIGGVVFFLVIILLLVLTRGKSPVQIPIFEPEETPTVVSDDPFVVRIENAKLDLEIADPANQDLTFPPVDMDIRIDEKKRR